jgi:hypothetical protein
MQVKFNVNLRDKFETKQTFTVFEGGKLFFFLISGKKTNFNVKLANNSKKEI